jgi:hypothetical protein
LWERGIKTLQHAHSSIHKTGTNQTQPSLFQDWLIGQLVFEQTGDRYLVDPASSHMLVSKIKPCMSKFIDFEQRNCEWLITTVIISLIVPYYMDNRGNSRANTCKKLRLLEGVYLLDKKPTQATAFLGES